MARRADDLLSIFDPNRSQGDGGSTGTRSKKPAGKKTTSRSGSRSGGSRSNTSRSGGSRGAQGLFLTQRQVVLGGSVAALLLVLSFTLGLVVGRPGGNDSPALRRDTGRVMVRATFPRQNPATRKPMTRNEVRLALTKNSSNFEVPERAIIDIREEGDKLVIELGPFPSDKIAQAYVQKWKLPAVHLNMDAPFRYHQLVKYSPRR